MDYVKVKINRVIAIILATLIVLSGISISTAVNVDAASSSIQLDYGTKIDCWTPRKEGIFDTKSGHRMGGTLIPFLKNSSTGVPVYCIKPGEGNINGNSLSSSVGSNVWNGVSADKRIAVALAIYYGYPNSNTSLVGNASERYLATQVIIWELIDGVRNSDLSDPEKYDGTQYTRYMRYIYDGTYGTWKNVLANYNSIISAMKKHTTVPSFGYLSNYNIPSSKTYEMEYNSTTGKYILSLTDTKGVVSSNGYNFTCSNSNVSITKSGNKLTLSSSKPVTGSITVTGKSTVKNGFNSDLVYGNTLGNQPVISSSTSKVDPVPAYFKIKFPDAGTLNITKEYKIGTTTRYPSDYDSTKFLIKNSKGQYIKAYTKNGYYDYFGADSNKHYFNVMKVGTNYKVVVKNLPVGTYTVQEVNSSAGFIASSDTKISITSGKTTSKAITNNSTTFTVNKEWVMDKTGVNYEELKSGVRFNVYDSNNNIVKFENKGSGNYWYPDSKTTSTISDLALNSAYKMTLRGLPKGTYKIKEIGKDVLAYFTSDIPSEGKNITITDKSSETTITNTANEDGTINITKNLKLFSNLTGKELDYIDSEGRPTSDEVFKNIKFRVINLTTGQSVYVGETLDAENGIYTWTDEYKGTNKEFSLGTTSRTISIIGLPYGKYRVLEYRYGVAKLFTPAKDYIDVEISSDSEDSKLKKVIFNNTYSTEKSLHIDKVFTDKNGTALDEDIVKDLYSKVSFYITKSDNTDKLYFKCTNEDRGGGSYTLVSAETEGAVTNLYLSNVSHTIDVEGLSEGDYIITEVMDSSVSIHFKGKLSDSDTQEIPISITKDVEGSLTAPDVTFENTLVTGSLRINKVAEDDLVVCTFNITRSDIPGWVKTVKTKQSGKTAEGKNKGSILVSNLPVYYYNTTTGEFEKIKYTVEEVTSNRYITVPTQTVTLNTDTATELKTVDIDFINTLRKGKIKVIKVAENEEGKEFPIEGISFTLTTDLPDDSIVPLTQTKVTDDKGIVEFDNLPAAVAVYNSSTKKWSEHIIKYTIHEDSTNSNKQFVLSDDEVITFDISTAGTYLDEQIVEKYNKLKRGTVYLNKVDILTGDILSGAEFTLYKDVNNDKKLDGKDVKAKILVNYLPKIDENTGEELFDESGNPIYQDVFNSSTLIESMSYQLSTDEEGNTTVDKDDNGNPIKVGTGYYSLSNIPYGNYILKETKSPDGYVDEGKEFAFSITEDEQVVHIYEETETDEKGNIVVTGYKIGDGSEDIKDDIPSEDNEESSTIRDVVNPVYNKPVLANVRLEKYDEETMQLLSGAKYRVYLDIDNNGLVDSSIDPSVGLMEELTDDEGKGTGVYVMNNLRCGKYRILERVAPIGYTLPKSTSKFTSSFGFEVTKDDDGKTITKFIRKVDGENKVIEYDTNKPIKGSVHIYKYDEETVKTDNKVLLPGAEFVLFEDKNNNGKIDAEEYSKVIPEILDNNNGTGEYQLNGILYGKYSVIETKAPIGYVLDDTVYSVNILDDGCMINLDNLKFDVDDPNKIVGVGNKPIRGDVEVFKYDEMDLSDLSDCTFTIKDRAGNIVQNMYAVDNELVFTGFESGTYTINVNNLPSKYSSLNSLIGLVTISDPINTVRVNLTKMQVPLKGAEFTLYDKDENVVGVETSSDNGIAVFSNIKYGNYTIKETGAPANYELFTDVINVKVDENLKRYSFTVENKASEGNLKIIKTSEDGKIEGVKFHIYGTSDIGTPVDLTVITGKNGTITTDKILVGTYKVDEVDTPEYYIPEGTKTVKVLANDTAEITFNNKLKKGSLKVVKTSDDNYIKGIKFRISGVAECGKDINMTAVTDENGVAVFNDIPITKKVILEEVDIADRYLVPENQEKAIEWNKVTETKVHNTVIKGNIEIVKVDSKGNVIKGLSGADFTLYDENNNAIKTLTTDSEGKVFFGDLPYGKYTVKEVRAPKGYRLDSTPIDFAILENGKTLTATKKNGEEEGNLSVIKTSEDGIVENVKIRIYGTSTIGTQIDLTLLTDKDGKVSVDNLLVGTYTVEELGVADYYVPQEPQVITIEDNKLTPVRFHNKLEKGNLAIIKTSEDGIVEGVKFHIYGTSDNGTKLNREVVTGKDGKILIENLLVGTYTVEEISMPTYYVTQEPKTVTIVKDETAKVDFENKLKYGGLRVIKTSEDNFVEGIEFRLQGTSDNGEKVDMKVKTDKTGIAEFNDVLIGSNYTLTEENIDVKYIVPNISKQKIEWNKVTNVGVKNDIKKGSVEIIKVDSENPEDKLSGAEFTLYSVVVDKENPLYESLVYFDKLSETSKGIYTLDEIPYGKYAVIETKSPEGYVLDKASHFFNITENHQVEKIETTKDVGFENKPIHGSIEIVKIDGESLKPLSGAEFTLYDSNNKPIKSLTTGKDGKVIFENLRYGDYTVVETKAPANYNIDSTPIPFSVLEDGKLLKYEKTNGSTSSDLEIIKTSEDNVVEGIKFHIYGTSDTGYVTDMYAITNSEGKLLLKDIKVGTYTVEEVEVPDRYLPQEPKTVKLIKNELAKVEFNNILVKGNVTLTKVDKEYPDNKLSGAEFTVYDSNGNKVDTLKEVEEGTYLLTDLIYGDYTLKETVTPIGFITDTNVYSFSIKDNNAIIPIENQAGVGFVNDAQKGSIRITKRSSDGKLDGFEFLVEGTAITGQKYSKVFITDETGVIEVNDLRIGTYTVSEVSNENTKRYILPDDKTVEVEQDKTTDVDMFNDEKEVPFELTKTDISTGKAIPNCGFRIRNSNGEIVAEGRTDEDGIAKFSLICGSYTYQEFDAPEGYIIDNTEYSFIINPDDTIVKASMTNVGTGDIEITKVDISTGDVIANCGIEILDENSNVIFQGRTDENGIVKFSLKYGKYYYREFDAPEGFVLDETPYAFEIKENGEIVKCEMDNSPIKGSVQVVKLDSADHNKRLSDAEFLVYTEKDVYVGKLEENTANKGTYILGNLRYGNYYLIESKAPKNFIIDMNKYYFSITKDGEIVTIENEEGVGFTNKGKPGEVDITKSDISTGELIPNCGIEILDENKNVIVQGRTDKNGVVKFSLNPGKYYYREFDAPTGYMLDETPYMFEILDYGEIVKCQMTNKKIPESPEVPEVPKTSDSTTMRLLVIIPVSLAVLTILTISKKRKKITK